MAEVPASPVVDTLGRLVAYPTISSRPVTEIVAYLAERAEAAGMRVQIFESEPGKANLVARAGPEGSDGLTLSGHLDVVPVEGQAWSSDPFLLTERQGRLHGRGACDMKGFVAAVCEALDALPLHRLERELALVWTHDEEVGCHGSRILVERFQREGLALPTQALIGEPTSMGARRMHPGHATFLVHCRGRAAHSSKPQLGLSAIKMAQEVLIALHLLEEELRLERAFEELLPTPWTVLNVGLIQGGNAVNIVPEHCTLAVGLRPLPGVSVRHLEERIVACLQEVSSRAREAGGEVEVEDTGAAPALSTRADAPILGLLAALTGQKGDGAVPFATDGGNLARLGLDCVVCGPGSIDLAHRPDESIGVDELQEAVDFVGRLVGAACGFRS